MKNNNKIISAVSTLHFIRLAYRSVLFASLIVGYIMYCIDGKVRFPSEPYANIPIVMVVWVIFMFEMLIRFFPSRLESHGSQKQFKRNYIKTGNTDINIHDNNSTVLVLLIWIVFNMIFGTLRMAGIFDDWIMILLCVFYSLCDMICILFFCPFQTLFMKNKCCSACRIYNWDYAMMFTPLFFVDSLFLKCLLLVSLALFLRWEITFYRHPEYFSENTNGYLKCVNCKEKLCVHKKQLRSFWKARDRYIKETLRRLSSNDSHE